MCVDELDILALKDLLRINPAKRQPPSVIRTILGRLKKTVEDFAQIYDNWPKRLMMREDDSSISTDMMIQGILNKTYEISELQTYHQIEVLKGYFAIYEIDIVYKFNHTPISNRHDCKPKAFLN